MGRHMEMILTAARRSFGYALKLGVGITPEIASRKPQGFRGNGPFTIDANHPMFVFGHLSLYPPRLMRMLGDETTARTVDVPAAWTDLFKSGVPCKEDPEGTIYPRWDVVWGQFERAYPAMLDALHGLDDAVLDLQQPEERLRPNFPTVGAALTFMLTSHVMVHGGQISTWRRCFGLPSAM